MVETFNKKHSKLGIASLFLAIGIWIYLVLMFGLIFKNENFTLLINDTFFKDAGIGGLGVALILLMILFGVIPIAGHILGAVFGIIGILQKTRKRLFGFIGLILNLIPFILGVVLFLTGRISPKSALSDLLDSLFR